MRPASKKSTGLLLLLTFYATTSGCSIAFVDGPPRRYDRTQDLDCSTSYTWPALDTGLGIFGLASIALALNQTSGFAGLDQTQEFALGIGFLTLFGISAATGYTRVSACNDAVVEREAPEPGHHHARLPPRPAPAPRAPDHPPEPASPISPLPAGAATPPTVPQQFPDAP